jgi:ubiquinone/menaquinone biosynthesis C-methylase UbiE
VPEVANTEQYEAWNGDSGRRWAADPDGRDKVLAPVAEALFSAAALRPGERVLDVGCGCGATTLAAAALVAPDGAAVGADLSAPMLGIARRRAADRAVNNVVFVQADAQTHTFDAAGFDVAVSRFGTMFFADPDAAFGNIAGTLRPGGRLCIATWQPLLENDWLTIPGAALLQFGSLPDAGGGPGMFAQSDPEAITSMLSGGEFDEVDIAAVTVALTLGADPAAATDYLADSGPGRAVLETVPAADQPAALEAVRAVLADHVTPAGVQLAGRILVTTARRPR